MNDVLLCPLRKTIKEVQDSVPLTKMETFQACLKEKCAWYDEENRCAVKSIPIIAEAISQIADKGILAATLPV
ncbi:hypothetical protein [Methanosarcina flavescens]|jgi:hypothetical protein|uniref:Uncharacterized protein n=1 Tax=Methanosarcina flavescens TaxID=1715806 RepID=A0A660HQE6_9EURY|nr:hypothetical protein [Methanosarcina flavescens]AYK14505.1 hypothetical protein AOB57_004240 [Methanosarcina flavescens]